MSTPGGADGAEASPGRERARHRGRFAFLLAMLVFFVFAAPAQHYVGHGALFYRATLVGSLMAGLYQMSRSKRMLAVGAALALPAVIGGALTSIERSRSFDAIELAFAAIFFALVGVYVLRAVLTIGRVDFDTLLGGISGYLLLVALFALLHTLTEEVSPGSYLEQGKPIAHVVSLMGEDSMASTMQYFSTVTATTLGYGDIVPVAPAARLLVSIEAILGQLYITILLAGLVGSLISARDERPPGEGQRD